MLTKLFESLDDKVFTVELKEALELQFNEAVDTKASMIAEDKIEEELSVLSEKSEEHIDFLNEKSEEHIDFLNEKSEEHIDFLNEKADEFTAIKQSEMTESVDKYLEIIVGEFIQEAKVSLDESIKSEKSELVLEAFDSMLIAAGVGVAQIVEAKDESSVSQELEESVHKYDLLIDETIMLKEENEKLLKMGIVAEMKEGLSIVQAEKFDRLSSLVEFVRDTSYPDKLETIVESVKAGTDSVKAAERTRSKTVTKNKSLNENMFRDVSDYSHLV